MYVIESPKPYEKLEKLKAWTDDHINKAFQAAEITHSEVQREFLFVREIKSLLSQFSTMSNTTIWI